MTKTLSIATALTLSACAVPQAYNPADLSPEQLNALAKDKAGVMSCAHAQTLGWSVTNVFINFDLGKLDGSIETSPPCQIKFSVKSPK